MPTAPTVAPGPPTAPAANPSAPTISRAGTSTPTAETRYSPGVGENVAGGPYGGFVPSVAPSAGYDSGVYDDGNYDG